MTLSSVVTPEGLVDIHMQVSFRGSDVAKTFTHVKQSLPAKSCGNASKPGLLLILAFVGERHPSSGCLLLYRQTLDSSRRRLDVPRKLLSH